MCVDGQCSFIICVGFGVQFQFFFIKKIPCTKDPISID